MDAKTFRQAVAGVGRHLPEESRTLALRHYVEHVERFTHESVRQCVQLAGLFAESATTPTTAAESADLPPTPTSVALSEHLRGKLQPWVQQLRRRLTGSPEPPCASLEEAVEWCQRIESAWLLTDRYAESEQRCWEHAQEAQQRVSTRLEQARQAQMEQPPQATPPGYRWAWQRYMPQETPPRGAEEVPPDLIERARQLLGPLTPRHILADMLECVRTHTGCAAGQTALQQYIQDHPDYQPILPMLERETRATERMTGFVQVDLAAHVLADTPLRLPAGRIYGHRIFQPGAPCGVDSRKYVVMELYAPDADFDQLRALYKQVRHALDLEGRKALSAHDQEFLALVDAAIQANGGKLPRGRRSGAKSFWERVGQQWNARMARQVYTGWDGPKRQYDRLQKRVKNLLN